MRYALRDGSNGTEQCRKKKREREKYGIIENMNVGIHSKMFGSANKQY